MSLLSEGTERRYGELRSALNHVKSLRAVNPEHYRTFPDRSYPALERATRSAIDAAEQLVANLHADLNAYAFARQSNLFPYHYPSSPMGVGANDPMQGPLLEETDGYGEEEENG